MSNWEIVSDVQTSQETPKTSSLGTATEISPSNESSNILENMLRTSAKDKIVALAAGSVAPVAGGAREAEDTLPAINGLLGGIIGGYFGKPNVGAGVGVSIGETQKQLIERMTGQRNEVSVQDILMNGGLTALSGKVLEVGAKAVGVSGKIIPERARSKFFDKVIQAVEIGKKKLVRNWDVAVNKIVSENPTQRVDLRGPLVELKSMLEGYSDDNLVPQLMTAVKRSPKLTKVVNNPSEAFDLNLKEAIELKNAITSTTNAITNRAIKGKTTPNERVVFDILDQFDSAITKNFPQMRDVRKAYSAGIQSYHLAKPLVERGTAVENTVFSKPSGIMGLGGTTIGGSTQGKLALKDIMSMTKPGGKMYEAAEYAHNLNRMADAVGRLLEISGGTIALHKLLGNKNDGE